MSRMMDGVCSIGYLYQRCLSPMGTVERRILGKPPSTWGVMELVLMPIALTLVSFILIPSHILTAIGCDCLGSIQYFEGYHHTVAGDPLVFPNVICCHEIDDGILWKHTNYRTGNAIVTRSRILVLQTIITVANYDYIFAFQFTQDAAVNYEVRATGILSTNRIPRCNSGGVKNAFVKRGIVPPPVPRSA